MNPTNKVVVSMVSSILICFVLGPPSLPTTNLAAAAIQTLLVSTKGQVRVSRHVMPGTVAPLLGVGARGRAAADCRVMGPRGGEEVTLDTRRRATAAHRPLARNTPPPAAETSAQPPPGQED